METGVFTTGTVTLPGPMFMLLAVSDKASARLEAFASRWVRVWAPLLILKHSTSVFITDVWSNGVTPLVVDVPLPCT